MSIGERITQLRKQQNISQLELARLMNVSRQAVSKWENDLSSPDTVRLIQLAEVLNTDVEYLATGNSAPKPEPEVIKVVETVDRVVEKIVEKPIIIQKTVEVDKAIPQKSAAPVVKRVIRTKFVRNPLEYIAVGIVCFLLGLLIGFLFL